MELKEARKKWQGKYYMCPFCAIYVKKIRHMAGDFSAFAYVDRLSNNGDMRVDALYLISDKYLYNNDFSRITKNDWYELQRISQKVSG